MKYSPLLVISLVLACHKAGQTSDLNRPYALPRGAEANPAYDHSSGGIYKGIGIDSQDDPVTTMIEIANDAWCLKYQHGILQDSLVRYQSASAGSGSTEPQQDHSTIAPGAAFQAVFESYDLKNWANGSVQLMVGAGGSNPIMNVTLFRNPATSAVLKEKSGSQVFCFLGTYSGSSINPAAGTDSGRIGLVYSDSSVNFVLISKGASPEVIPYSTGSVTGGQLNIHVYDSRVGGTDFIFTGNISGNICQGTWQRPGTTAVGQFNLQRTL